MLKCNICGKHIIYNEDTREEYSLDYFFSHVAPIKKGDYNYCAILRRHINEKTDRSVLHVDTYLKDNIWRVQIVVATTTIDINYLSQFINRMTIDKHTLPGSALEVIQEGYSKPWLGFVMNYNLPFVD